MKLPTSLLCSVLFVALIGQQSRAGIIVNIDATQYGFAFPTDPAPVPGQLISPFSLAPGSALNQVSLSAGTYTITNATGILGANTNFTGWRFNSSSDWVWGFVIADAVTNRVLLYGDAGQQLSSQAALAAQPSVQNFSTNLVLAAPTTLNFMIRDYFLPDNAGGVALNINSTVSSVPEQSSFAMFAGLAIVTLCVGHRKRVRSLMGRLGQLGLSATFSQR